VTVNAKKCLGDAQHLLINPPHSPFCVEISLRTPDCDTITLETWCISFDDSLSDPSQRIRFNIYNRMSIVLRSLLTCTRATPSYHLSRKQSADKYIICYKMYSGEPIVSHLGEHYSKKTIGSIITPIGRFVLNVAYRTRFTMALTQIENRTVSNVTPFGIDIKDDHFSIDRNQHSVEE
jgi:autophagy-related protein 13